VTDALGQKVAVPANPRRVVALSEPTLDGTLALGVRPVAATAGRGQSGFPAYLGARTRSISGAGGLGQPSLEDLAQLRPDLILVDGTAFPSGSPIAGKLPGIAPTVYVSTNGADWKPALLTLGNALGRPAQARRVLSRYDARVASLRARLGANARAAISIVRWSGFGLPAVLKQEIAASRVLADLGLRRPKGQDRRGPGHTVPISLERLDLIDGDWIFLGALGTGSTGGVADADADVAASRAALRNARETPGFTRLRAVRAGRVVPVDGSAWTSAGGPLAEATVLDDVERTLAAPRVGMSAAAWGSSPARPRVPKVPKFPPPVLAQSPTITALRDALAARRPGALARFWALAEASGTPLVEPAPGAPDRRIVTFLWRGGGELRDVLLLANKHTDPSVQPESTLERLRGSDVWHRSYLLGADWRASYQLVPLTAATDGADAPTTGPTFRWGIASRDAHPDPLNPRRFPGRDGGQPLSIAELPEAAPQPWLTPQPGVRPGNVVEHRLRSDVLGNERRVWLYAPVVSDPAGPPPALLVLLDGEDWVVRLGVATTLDNLIAAGRIPPTFVVMVDALDLETRWRELTCAPSFVAFLTDELLPWVTARHAVSARPEHTTISGRSLGGLTALFASLLAPRRFGAVLAQSASLWWPAGSPNESEAGALLRQAVAAPRLPGRCYLEVGLQEWTLLGLHRHLRDVLALRDVRVSYREYHGGHDALCWRGGLADGLIALAGDAAPAVPGSG